MPEEPTGTEGRHNAIGMDLFERRLWFGGLLLVLFFIGIAILISGHRCHRRVMTLGGPPGWGMQMGRPGMEGPPPPPWGGPGGYRGWGPNPWQYPGGQYEQPRQQPPAPSAPPIR